MNRTERMVANMFTVITSTHGRTRFGAALHAARESFRAFVAKNFKQHEYHAARKMFFTGKLTPEGMRAFCEQYVASL